MSSTPAPSVPPYAVAIFRDGRGIYEIVTNVPRVLDVLLVDAERPGDEEVVLPSSPDRLGAASYNATFFGAAEDRDGPDVGARAHVRVRGILADYRARYMGGAPGELPDAATVASDLLADLRHFCEREGLDYVDVLERAEDHFNHEAADPGRVGLEEPSHG